MVSGNLCPVFGSIQVLGKDIQPGFLEVRLAEVKKKTTEMAFLIEAVYGMIDRRAISPVLMSHRWVYRLFLMTGKEEMAVSDS